MGRENSRCSGVHLMNMVYIGANQGRCCLEYNLRMEQLMKHRQPRSLPCSHCPLLSVSANLVRILKYCTHGARLRTVMWRRLILTTGENAHDTKTDVEECQGVRHEAPHTAHPAHGAEDTRGAVRAPHDGGGGHDDAQGRVHGHDDPEQAGGGQGQQAVAKDGGAAEVGQGRGQLVGVAVGRGRLVARLVGAVGGRLRGAVAVLEGGHERDDEVERYRAKRGEAVDVAEVEVAREEEEEAEEAREEDGPAQVAVVHQVLVDAAEGVEHGECLWGEELVRLPPAS